MVLSVLAVAPFSAAAAPQADLTADGPDASVSPGETFEITYTLENTGDEDAGSAALELSTPDGVSVAGVSGDGTGAEGAVFYIDGIAQGESVTTTVTYQVASDAADGDQTVTTTGIAGDSESVSDTSVTVSSADDGDDGEDDEPTTQPGDATLREGARYWSGQEVSGSGFAANDQGVELQRFLGDGRWQFVTQVTVDSNGDLLLDTSDYSTDQYRIIDTQAESGDTTAENVEFEISEQTYSASADPATVLNRGSTTTDVTVDSNRVGYTHVLSSPEVDASTIQALLGGAGEVSDFDGDDENELLIAGGTTSDTLTADFAGVEAGNYTINFMVADTGVTASTTVTVEAAEEGDVAFENSVYTEEQGDVASIVVNMENGASEATITIGSEDVNYLTNVTVTDEDDDGQVTLLWNTATAATAGGSLSDTLQAADDDSVSNRNLITDRFSDSASRLGATEYPLSAELNGEERAVGVVSVSPPDNVDRSAATWTAPASIASDDLVIPDNLTQDSTVAEGDYVVLQFETAGIYGSVFDTEDLAGTDGVSVSITETQESAGVNTDPKTAALSNFDLVRDEANNQFFLVAKQSALTNVDADDTFEATLAVDSDANPYATEDSSVATTFSVTAQSATLDVPSEGTLQVEGSENGTIAGTSTLAPGSQVTVRIRKPGGENPFLRQTTVEVGENGDFSANFDLSDIPAGTNFSVNVLSGGTQLVDETVPATVGSPATADVQLVSGSLDAPATASPGETITVTAMVENAGDAAGSEDVSFVFEGETVATQSVDLDAGASDQVSFEAQVPSETGEYTHGVQVGDNEVVTAGITVEEPPTTTTTEPTTTEPTTTEPTTTEPTTTEPTTTEPTTEPPETTTEPEGQPGFGVAVALVALVAAALLAVRRDN